MGELYGDCELALRLDVVTRWQRVQEHCEGGVRKDRGGRKKKDQGGGGGRRRRRRNL